VSHTETHLETSLLIFGFLLIYSSALKRWRRQLLSKPLVLPELYGVTAQKAVEDKDLRKRRDCSEVDGFANHKTVFLLCIYGFKNMHNS
jgi:hypothetical protein